MNARSFFDTNVLVYTDDADAPANSDGALDLWQEHRSQGLAVIQQPLNNSAQSCSEVPCIQVMQEYFRAATRKLNVDPGIATEKLMLFGRADVVSPHADDVVSAARLMVEH